MKTIGIFFKKNYKFLFILFFILLYNLLSYYELCSNSNDMSNKFKILFLIFIALVDFIILFFLFVFKKRETLTFERKYLIIGFFIGMVYLIAIPVMKGTDEAQHFYRAYQISSGNIVINDVDKDVTLIPKNLYDLPYTSFNEKYSPNTFFEKQSSEFVEIRNSETPINYSPFQYIPQVLAIIISKIFGFSPMIMVFFTRFINFISWLFITYIAIKIVPFKKEFIAILYLSPAMLSLTSTASGDALLDACILLFISLILRQYHEKKEMKRKDFYLLMVLSIIISSIKFVYIPVLFLLLVIPKEYFNVPMGFKNKLDKKKSIIIILLVCMFFIVGWNLLTSNNSSFATNKAASEQLSFVITNPISYCLIIFRTFTNNTFYYLTNLVAGNEMCNSNVTINELLVLFYFILLILSYFYCNRRLEFKIHQKFAIWILFLLIMGAVSSAMYIYWTISYELPGGNSIIGIQSRYFIALIPILILTLPIKNKRIEDYGNQNLFSTCLILNGLILIQTVGSLLTHFFNM